jgi:hypothetical protein
LKNYHVNIVVVPQRHDKDHALLESVTHGLHATGASEVVVVTEDGLLVLAEGVGDRVTANTSDIGRGLLPDLAALNVQTTDLDKVAAFGVVGGDELSHNGDRLLGVDRLARAVERLVAHAEGVEIATVSVAVTVVSVAIAVAAGGVSGAGAVSGHTRVRSEGVGDGVRLPDISNSVSALSLSQKCVQKLTHFVAAGSSVAEPGVGVVGSSAPALRVGFSFDELDIARALGIAVASAVLDTGLVGRGNATIGRH